MVQLCQYQTIILAQDSMYINTYFLSSYYLWQTVFFKMESKISHPISLWFYCLLSERWGLGLPSSLDSGEPGV